MTLGTTTRSLLRSAKTQFPGARDADLQDYVRLQFEVALANGTRRGGDDEITKLVDAAFNQAVEDGTQWAVALQNSFRDSKIAPLVEKARNKGVDPVSAVVLNTDLSADEARAMIASLDAAKADADAQVVDDVDSLAETETEDSDVPVAAYH